MIRYPCLRDGAVIIICPRVPLSDRVIVRARKNRRQFVRHGKVRVSHRAFVLEYHNIVVVVVVIIVSSSSSSSIENFRLVRARSIADFGEIQVRFYLRDVTGIG